MGYNNIISFFFFFSLCVSTNFSQAIDLVALSGGPDACLQKLLPCKDYIKSPSPPSTCCDPLKDIVSTNMQCLCKAMNDPDSMKSLNITEQDALGLAKSCGSNVDASVCKTGSNSTAPGTNTTAASPAPSAAKSGSSAVFSNGGKIFAFSTVLIAVFYSH